MTIVGAFGSCNGVLGGGSITGTAIRHNETESLRNATMAQIGHLGAP
jgi:hypothetical protein